MGLVPPKLELDSIEIVKTFNEQGVLYCLKVRKRKTFKEKLLKICAWFDSWMLSKEP